MLPLHDGDDRGYDRECDGDDRDRVMSDRDHVMNDRDDCGLHDLPALILAPVPNVIEVLNVCSI